MQTINHSKNDKKDNSVFITGLVLVLGIVLVGMAFPDVLTSAGNTAMGFLTSSFGWLYNSAAFIFVIFSLAIGVSRFGHIKLGDGAPEYSIATWFAMLFSAGMGIGLVFWGVAEPLNHWLHPVSTLESGSVAAAQFAMEKSFLHWGLQPWAIYSVLGLPLAYIMYCRKKDGLISNLLLPFMGKEGPRSGWGKLINILALFATAAGIATSLGLGAQQINSGLAYTFGVPDTGFVKIVMVSLITVLVVLCTISGMQKGIKYMSNLNLAIAGTILVLAFVFGPTVSIMNSFTNTLGGYIQNWFGSSLAISDDPWYGSWTSFYMAWWIAWSPFCAPFIAKVSRGRTIREFVLGVLVAPSLGSFVWFAIFGTLGMNAGIDVAREAIQSTSTALFVVMDGYPMGTLISLLIIFVLFTFFITSANGATYVLGTLSSNGDLEPSIKMKVTWAVLQSALALVLMLGSENGLNLLQTISLVAAFPFVFVLFLSMGALVKFLYEDHPAEKAGTVSAKVS